jgi:hypothetical protein
MAKEISSDTSPDNPTTPSDLKLEEKSSFVENSTVLSQSLLDALSEAHAVVTHIGDDGKIFIDSAEGDPDSPRSWPAWKRYCIVFYTGYLFLLVRAYPLFRP